MNREIIIHKIYWYIWRHQQNKICIQIKNHKKIRMKCPIGHKGPKAFY